MKPLKYLITMILIACTFSVRAQTLIEFKEMPNDLTFSAPNTDNDRFTAPTSDNDRFIGNVQFLTFNQGEAETFSSKIGNSNLETETKNCLSNFVNTNAKLKSILGEQPSGQFAIIQGKPPIFKKSCQNSVKLNVLINTVSTSIWGMETGFGTGSYLVLSATVAVIEP